MALLAAIIFVFGMLWTIKGSRLAVCSLPAMFFFLIGGKLIWSFLTPDHYPGDFLDMFLPLVTIPIGLILSIPLLMGALFIMRKTLAFANRSMGPQEPLPLLSPSRLPGLLAMVLAIGLIGMGDSLEKKSLTEYEEKSEQIISDFFAGKTGGGELKQAFIERPILCRKPYTEQIDSLLETDPQRAGIFLNAMTDTCEDWTESYKGFVDSRKVDGTVRHLDALLTLGLLDTWKIRGSLVSYLTAKNNQDELLRIFTHYYSLARSTTLHNGTEALSSFISIAGFNRDVLAKILVIAGKDPTQYLREFDIDGISYHLLSNAALNLDVDLMRACLALGFTKENTGSGSVLFAFVRYRGGSTVIRKLLEKGVNVNALNARGETALGCVLSAKPATYLITKEEEDTIAEVMDILFSLCAPDRYLEGGSHNTPLHSACEAGQQSPHGIEEIKLLMRWGANPDLGAVPPLEAARRNGWDELFPILTPQ